MSEQEILKQEYLKSKCFENPAGVKCFSEDDFFKIQVSGSQSDIVRDRINSLGSCKIEVEFLEELESGKLRMPVCKEIKDVA